MKNIKFALILFVFALLAGVMSCSKESFNINKNPNNATDSTVAYNVLLPSALNSTARVVSRSWGWLQNYLGYWARSGTYAPNADEESYQITTSFQSGIWSGLYDNLYDYQAMQIGASKAGATFYEGIARIMKAHNFAMLVDIYGNVPYSEALKGASVTTPKYDKGLDIYKDLLRQLDLAIDQIKNADESETGPNANVLTDDVMFGTKLFPTTDIHEMKTHWIQFANTLKLRMLTKCMNGGLEINGTAGTDETTVTGIDLDNEFTIIANEGTGFMTDINAEINPGYQADKGNPFYNLYVRDDAGSATSGSVYYKANAYACGDGGIDPGYYNYNGDRRRTRFYTTNNSGAYRGVQYGLPPVAENVAASLSGIGAGVYRGVDKAQWIITRAESYFLQAECMNRGYLSGDAQSTLESGISSSFLDLGLTAANATSYITGNAGYPDVDYAAPALAADVAEGGLFTIISQKWFALNAIAPFEVWSDYRRIDFSGSTNHFIYGESVGYNPGPAMSVYPSNTKTELPVRLLYPQSEYLYNPANVGAQPPAGAYPFAHVFWDLH
jgi:hypothetical protein